MARILQGTRLGYGSVVCSLALASLLLASACDEKKPAGSLDTPEDGEAQKLPEVRPNLPKVPKLQAPEFPIQYGDGSYSIYGLRKRLEKAMNKDLKVTGYIVEIYEPPECPKGKKDCPMPKVPHIWMADKAGETEFGKKLQVAGYAERDKQVKQARAAAGGAPCHPKVVEEGQVPVPADFEIGNKIKVSGLFTRVSGSGFNTSEGLIEYKECHETVEKAAGGAAE